MTNVSIPRRPYERKKKPVQIDGSVALVELSKGMTSLIDAADAEIASAHNWYAAVGGNGRAYAATRTSARARAYLHNLILLPPPGMIADHINGDSLDNRRANLRCATHPQNVRSKPRKTPTRGVYKVGSGLFVARLHIGTYATADEARRAYDDAERLVFGEFAWPDSTKGPRRFQRGPSLVGQRKARLAG